MSRSRQASVGVVIVNRNGWPHAIAACRSLYDSTYPMIKIVVVDNASVDDSLTHLRAALPYVDIIANPVNVGFSGACNVGMRHVMELGCEYVFLLTNDGTVESKTIAQLVAASQAKDDAALLGAVVTDTSSREYQFFGSRTDVDVSEQRYFTLPSDERLLRQRFIETDAVIGAAFFIPAKVLARTGPFDERFFLNYGEADLCSRAKVLGIPSFVVPSAIVHRHASAIMGPRDAPVQVYFLTRNSLLFADKHAAAWQRIRIYAVRLRIFCGNVRKSWGAGTSIDLPTRAMARAFWDHAWRRFGDCPAAIRRHDSVYRGMACRPYRAGSDRAKQRAAWLPGKGGALFQRETDGGRPTVYGVVSLLAQCVVIALMTSVIGGVFLSKLISMVARIFRNPDFAALGGMGFAMAGVAGVFLASWFLVSSLRQSSREG